MDDKIMENVRKTSIYRIMTSEIGITNMKFILFSDRSYAWHGLIMEEPEVIVHSVDGGS